MGFSLLNRNNLYLWLVAGFPKSSPGFLDMDRKSSTILGCWKKAISHHEHFTAGVHCRGCWPNEPLKESNFKPTTLGHMPTHEEKKILGIKEKKALLNHTTSCSTSARIPPTTSRIWRIPWKGKVNIVHLEGTNELNQFYIHRIKGVRVADFMFGGFSKFLDV